MGLPSNCGDCGADLFESGGASIAFGKLLCEGCRVKRAIAAPRPGAWQPIATAPKDGTRIMLFGEGVASSGSWSRTDGWSLDWENRSFEVGPTHWAPFDPPKEQP